MIGLIYGKVDSIKTPYVVVDTGGVGYKILVPQGILNKITVGTQLKVYTYTNVREDALDLFGFETPNDLALFEQFLTVPGIGPKTAIGIFAAGTTPQIRGAVLSSDVSFFSQVPRLGHKNAQKIILELKNKMGGDDTLDIAGGEEEKELFGALKNFGFKSDEINTVLKKIRGQKTTIEDKMRFALKHLAK